jgi:hypothetical protein
LTLPEIASILRNKFKSSCRQRPSAIS